MMTCNPKTIPQVTHNDLVNRAHFHNVLKLLVHVSQCKLTCTKKLRQRICLMVYKLYFSLTVLCAIALSK